MVAFEAAQQLAARGVEVQGLILIDAPRPVDHEPLPPAIIAAISRPNGQSGHFAAGSRVALEEEYLSNASLLGSYKPKSHHKATGKRLKAVMLRSQEVQDTEALWGVRYDWLSRQDARSAAVLAWEALVGGPVKVLPIPGNHFEPFLQDNVSLTLSLSAKFPAFAFQTPSWTTC